MKGLMSGAAVFALAAFAFAVPASAQCMWTGYDWSCGGAAPPAYAQPYSGAYQYPGNEYYPGYGYGYGYGGYRPGWQSQYPGPRASGH